MSTVQQIKLCIIDDNDSYREYIKALIEEDARIRLVGDYNSPIPFIAQLNSPFQPDVCLVDVLMPEMSGLDCAKIIRAKHPSMHIILITNNPSSQSIEMAKILGTDYIQKGTIGEKFMDYIITNINSTREFVLSIHREYEEKFKLLINMLKELESVQQNVSLLSQTQKKVLQLRKEDKSVNEIAEMLDMTPSTVSTHINRALFKLKLPKILDYIHFSDEKNIL